MACQPGRWRSRGSAAVARLTRPPSRTPVPKACLPTKHYITLQRRVHNRGAQDKGGWGSLSAPCWQVTLLAAHHSCAAPRRKRGEAHQPDVGQGGLEGLSDEARAELGGAVPQPGSCLGPARALCEGDGRKSPQVGGVVEVAPPQLCVACLSPGACQRHTGGCVGTGTATCAKGWGGGSGGRQGVVGCRGTAGWSAGYY